MSSSLDIKIYSTPICPFCDAAKRLCQQKGWEYEDINLSRSPDLRLKLSEENGGWRTVPMIFVNDVFIGGFQEFQKAVQQGKLP